MSLHQHSLHYRMFHNMEIFNFQFKNAKHFLTPILHHIYGSKTLIEIFVKRREHLSFDRTGKIRNQIW